MSFSVLVVGGGVIGLSNAWELARRGAQVHLVDRRCAGREASWAGAGMLPSVSRQPSDPLEQLRTLSHELHRHWAERLRSFTGIDTGYHRCGGLHLATSSGEAATLAAQATDWHADGILAEKMLFSEAVAVEEVLSSIVESGRLRAVYRLENDCQLRNPRHLQALRAACIQSGVTLLENSEVIGLASARFQRVEVQLTNKALVVDKVCFSGGAWTGQWFEQWGIPSSIYPVRGQMVLMRFKQPLFSHLLLEGNRYLVPREDGHVLIGSNEEEVGFKAGVTENVIDELTQWAFSIVPELRFATIEQTWSGFRPASIDGLPFICEVPTFPSLYLAAGHFRAGLHLSCATAVCLADLMFGETPPINLDAFRASRGYTANR